MNCFIIIAIDKVHKLGKVKSYIKIVFRLGHSIYGKVSGLMYDQHCSRREIIILTLTLK